MIKEFKLGGCTWEVKVDNKSTDVADIYGQCNFTNKYIIINDKRRDEAIEQTIWHEIVHAILREMEFGSEMTYDESFVNRLAVCLHQIDKTRK